VILDEIGGREEAEALASLLRGGTLAVASAHAASYADLCRRGALRPFFEAEAFDAFLGIKRENGHIVYEEISDQIKERRNAKCCASLA
jgi:stage III sporulation protein AA